MIGITGHTAGIAKYIFDRFNCIGFSRSNGYDIDKKEDRLKIINNSRNVDVFINSACSGYSQTHLLKDFVEHNPSMKVINIGSRVSEVILPDTHKHLINYQKHKLALKIACQKYGYEYKWFGYVATERVLRELPEVEKISIQEAVSIILES